MRLMIGFSCATPEKSRAIIPGIHKAALLNQEDRGQSQEDEKPATIGYGGDYYA